MELRAARLPGTAHTHWLGYHHTCELFNMQIPEIRGRVGSGVGVRSKNIESTDHSSKSDSASDSHLPIIPVMLIIISEWQSAVMLVLLEWLEPFQ